MEINERQRVILSAMRVLSLLFGFKSKKSFNMTFDRLILFDFYMKYPETMFGDDERFRQYDFEELYSYYHSQPNRESYYQILSFLRSKNLVNREIINGSYRYLITTDGMEIIRNFDNEYAIQLMGLSAEVAKKVSKLSENDLKEEILSRTAKNIHKAVS